VRQVTIVWKWFRRLPHRLLGYLAVIGSMAFPLGFSIATWAILETIAPGLRYYGPAVVFLLTGVGFIVHVRTRLEGMGPPYGFAILLSFLIAIKLASMIPVDAKMICDPSGRFSGCGMVNVTFFEKYIRGEAND